MSFLAAVALHDDETCLLEDAQMLHYSESRHALDALAPSDAGLPIVAVASKSAVR